MRKEYQQLVEYINTSRKILISSHLAPDHDSIMSTLLFKRILEQYYPGTDCDIVFEQPWSNRYSALGVDLSEIFSADEVELQSYDLLVMVDVHQLERTFDKYYDEVNELPSIAIDHHELAQDISCDLLIHQEATAATEVVYHVFNEILGEELVPTPEMARYIQIGILLDSARFMWNSSPETYRLMADMMEIEPINVELIWNEAAKKSRKSLFLFNHILQNAKFEEDMVYSYIDDENVTELEKFSQRDMNHAASMFLNDFSRTIEDVNWGFLVKGSTKDSTLWRVSFRSVAETENVLKYAEALNGGGYVTAASGTVEADSPQEATVKVWEVINKVRSENNEG